MATFSLGCFWGAEASFAAIEGVVSTRVGYTGAAAGAQDVPATYASVSGGDGHAESVRVVFDPARVSYAALLQAFFSLHSSTRRKPKVCYRSAVWAHSEAQLAEALAAKAAEAAAAPGGAPVLTEVALARRWWEAEERHQRYSEKRAAKLKWRPQVPEDAERWS